MRERTRAARPPSNRRYTRAVTARTFFATSLLAGFFAANTTLTSTVAAQNPSTDPAAAAERAAAAAQAAERLAKEAAALAEKAAEAQIPPDGDQPTKDPVKRARKAIVLLERGGKLLGVGSVLSGDGRILTALSQLGHGNDVDARFADGSVARVKLGHTDRAWDLALLIPKTGRWTNGLKASRSDATKAGSQLRAFRTLNAKNLAPSRVIVKGLRTLRGGDSELLPDAVELASRFKESDVGSPIIDDQGHVVAMVARACNPSNRDTCQRVPYGVPVSAIKAFLRTAPRDAVAPAPWLGIQGVAADAGPVKGVRVLGVHPKSPAGAAGLRGGRDKNRSDVVVAVDGVPVTSPEALSSAVQKRAVGDTVQLLLFGSGRFRQVTVSLKAAPSPTAGKKKVRSTAKKPRSRSVRRSTKPRPRPRPRPRPIGY